MAQPAVYAPEYTVCRINGGSSTIDLHHKCNLAYSSHLSLFHNQVVPESCALVEGCIRLLAIVTDLWRTTQIPKEFMV